MKSVYSDKFQLCIDLLKSGNLEDARREFLNINEPNLGSAANQLYKKLKEIIINGGNSIKIDRGNNDSADGSPPHLLPTIEKKHPDELIPDYFGCDQGKLFTLSEVDSSAVTKGISIVTACMNREENLFKVLPSWLKTNVDEIIIVDWSSDQPIADRLISLGDSRIKVVRINDERAWILTHAFNVGLRFASRTTVFKLDSDIEIKSDFFILNKFNDGEFVRGFWKFAVESGDEKQKFVNGTFGAKKINLKKIGYYDERILTYGWDDSDIYYRLCMDHGLVGRFIDPNSIYHVDQKEAQRTEKQDINKNTFLGRYQSTEYEGGKNKYLTINNVIWGDYFPFHNYEFKFISRNFVEGIRSTVIENSPHDLLEIADILSSRQLLLWNATDLKNVSYEDQKRLDFARLFSDAHKYGLSELLLNAIKLKKAVHFVLVDDAIIAPAVNKTVALMRHHVQNSEKFLVIIENIGGNASCADYLSAPRELILRLAEAVQSKQFFDISHFEDRMATGQHTTTLTKVSLVTVCEEASNEATKFVNNLCGDFLPSSKFIYKTCLVTSLYDEYNLIRLVEYFACFILNLDTFEKIIVIYESKNNLLFSLLSVFLNTNGINTERVFIIPFNSRPRFDQLFRIGNQQSAGYMLSVANADIVFDASVENLVDGITDTEFVVLSRRDVSADGRSVKLIRLDNGCPNTFSADAWIVRTPFEPDFRLDFEIGTMHCDSFINFQAGSSQKYKILNPCLSVKIFHLHDERFNSSDEKSIKDREIIEKRYGEEWVRCGNQDPVRGISWSGLKAGHEFGVQEKLQRWRPKTLVIDTSAQEFQLGALFILNLFSNILNDIQDIGIVVCINKEEIDSTVEHLLSAYRREFKRNIIIEVNETKYDKVLARAKMCHTNSLNTNELISLIQTRDKEVIREALIKHTQWPGIEGIKLVRGEILLNLNDDQHLKLFNTFKSGFDLEYNQVFTFMEGLERWSPSKNGIMPLLETVKDCTLYAPAPPIYGNPDVTFVTSLFRGGEYLKGYLENISLAAFQCNGEVIIVDANCDGSEAHIVKKYLDENPSFSRICTYIELSEDPGLYECWNLAIKRSKGKYITNANLDDRRSPFHVKKLVKFLEQNEAYAAASSDIFAVTNGDLANFFSIRSGEVWFYDEGSCEITKDDLYTLSDGNVFSRNIMHCMPLWRRDLHQKYGYFNEELYGTSADWEFWLRVTSGGETLYHLAGVFGLYLINPNSHNRRDEKSLAKEKNIIRSHISGKEMNNINIVVGHTYHLTMISLLVFSHVSENESGTTFMVYRDYQKDTWVNLGCLKNKNSWISYKELKCIIEETGCKKVNFVVHHYEHSFDDLISNLYDVGILGLAVDISFSYYCDGYTNHFLYTPYENILQKYSYFNKINHYKAYVFDVLNSYPDLVKNGVEIEVINSVKMASLVYKYNFRDYLAKVFELVPRKFENYVLVAMRPWGSSDFHSGAYRLAGGGIDLYKITRQALNNIGECFSGSTVFLLRGTSRDNVTLSEFYQALRSSGFETNYFVLDDSYPDWLPLDPFIFLFKDILGRNLNTFTFDSTTALPIISVGSNEMHFFGVEENYLRQTLNVPESFMVKITGHVNNLRRHILTLNKSNIKVVDCDASSFIVET